VKGAKFDSITQIVFSHTRCPHLCSLEVTMSHCLIVVDAVACCSQCLLRTKKKHNVSSGHIAHVKLCFSTKIKHFFLYVHVTVLHRNKFLYNETNICTNFLNLLWLKNEPLHVSDRSSAHHQEFIF
jgi:hypothetical protein